MIETPSHLHPPLAVATRRPGARFLFSHPAHAIALGLGSGLSPAGPGTVGTLWAWLAFVAFDRWLEPWQWGAVLLAGFVIGWWACTVTARHLAVAAPSAIVWDEVLAFWLVLWLVTPAGFWTQLCAFLLFRFFDIAKPGPVAWADGLFKARHDAAGARLIGWRQGFGILLDDLVAACAHCADRAVEGLVNAALHDLSAFEPAVLALADALRSRSLRIVTAESCTGGLIAAACTSVAGSSDWFERSFVTYSNEAKSEMLQVGASLLANFGAVSAQAVDAMALGALANSRADWSVAVTGIAGPAGATPGKPVGTVWIAMHAAAIVRPRCTHCISKATRATVRGQTVSHALAALRAAVSA